MDNFQRRDLISFQFEEVSKIYGAAGKVPGEPAGDDSLSVLLFARERLARVFILCRGICLPFFDRGRALVGVSLVLHDGIFNETLRERLAVTFVRGEVRGDRRW